VARIVTAGTEDSFACDWLQGLCDSVGARLAGSPGYEAAVAYAVRTATEAGFDRVWTEPFDGPCWVRGAEHARVLAPVEFELPILGIGMTVGTPAEGIEAEVLAVTDFAELEQRAAEAEGRIVLFNPPWGGYGESVQYRTKGAVEAARHGAVAVLVRSVTNHSLATLHTGMMSYADDVAQIPAACVTVEDAGRLQRLSKAGATIRVRMLMDHETPPACTQANVIAELRGRERPDEIVLIGGHLDSWDVGTGAHDDGAGCAITLAAAQLLAKLELRPRRTVRVVLFACEELGGHGGQAYASAHADEVSNHVAALESDSGSFAPRGFTVRSSDAVIARLGELAAPLSSIGAEAVSAGWAGVDIHPIVELGVPGIGHRTHHDAYFHYHHSPADTFDKIDPEDLARNVAAVAALTWLIAEDETSLRDLATEVETE
jgi:carboxypeptidase Q